MENDSEKVSENAEDVLKVKSPINEDLPCEGLKSSDSELKDDEDPKSNKSIELNGCDKTNCKSPVKTEDDSQDNVPDSNSVNDTSVTKNITKETSENEVNNNDKEPPEKMEIDEVNESAGDKVTNTEKETSNSLELKTNNNIKESDSEKTESDVKAMEVDSSPAELPSKTKKSRKAKKTSRASSPHESLNVESEEKSKITEVIVENKAAEDDKDESNCEEQKKSEEKEDKDEESKSAKSKAVENIEIEKVSSPVTPGTPKSESKSKSEGSEKKKKKKDKTCEECRAKKGLKFQVVFQGKMHYLCSDVCYKAFKDKQKSPKTADEPKQNAGIEICGSCKKELKESKGYFPNVGEVKSLCSEECLLNYQENNVPKKVCSQCKVEIEDDLSCLSWETMEFCNEDCLGKFQSFLGSHCTCCQSPVQQTSLGKYCVCFGADIRQFCSGTCLEEFKKGLKVCSYCQKDLSTGSEGFLAPVGDKGMFKDFCTQQCMERYEAMNNTNNSSPEKNQNCSFCEKSGNFKIKSKHEDQQVILCSEICVAGYRFRHKITKKICDTCYKFFTTDSEISLQFEGKNKYYCSKSCMTLFVLSHRKIVPCTWCKVKKYNFDMIEKLESSNQTQTYCSLNCISLYRVSVNATSAKSIRCDSCSKNMPAQYHLTMSDGSIRNFCTYPCVISFQNQFTNVPTLTTSTPSTKQATPISTVIKTTLANASPVVSSVMSLSAPRSPAPKLVPQKLISSPSPRQSSPSLAIITTKAATPSQTNTTTPTSNASSQYLKEVIVRPPAPKSMKNKSVLCRPIMQTKGVSCKPHPCHKAVQTEESALPAVVPIPVPIYVPTPVHMFSRPVPCPVPFPIPIPVPIFIPTSKDTPAQVLKQLKDIQEKIPSNPYEAELLMMAEMVAEKDDKKGQNSDKINAIENSDNPSHIPTNESSNANEVPVDVEAECPPGIAPMIIPIIPKDQDPDNEDYYSKDGRTSGKRPASTRGRGRGKRARLDCPPPEDHDSFSSMPLLEEQNSAHQSDSSVRLKHTYGVNAWKHWVLQKNVQLEKGSHSSRKVKLFKTDLLQLPPDELNYSLCLFVKEVRKPSGEEYAPACIYYLCLGIQQYLFENGRIDNIFTDPYYEKFTECLNDVLQNKKEVMTAEGYYVSKIEEEVLWESKQLGAHSPHVLLNTLMYFNTKYFHLKSVDDHARLSFSHITKHWCKTPVKAGPRSVILRYYPPANKDWQNRKIKEENQAYEPNENIENPAAMYEQNENVENPLRCPVKLYEFYLSKCPESVKTRNDVFYLYPERSCVPDSPVWYSTQPFGRDMISKMLQRIKAIREVYET